MCLGHTLLTHDSSLYLSYEVAHERQPENLPFNQPNDSVTTVPKFSVIYMIYVFDISIKLEKNGMHILNVIWRHFNIYKIKKKKHDITQIQNIPNLTKLSLNSNIPLKPRFCVLAVLCSVTKVTSSDDSDEYRTKLRC
jgi:hypothetical protein